MNNGLLMLIVLVAAIAIGFITNINTGVISLGLAYLFGSFLLGIKPGTIQGYWPAKIFFVLFTVSFFYNYATNNGTLDKLAKLILYKFGRSARMLPFILMVVAWVMAAAGAGPYSIIALLAPISFIICDSIGMNKVLAGLAVYFGAVAGGMSPTCSTGATGMSIIASTGYDAEAMSYQLVVLLVATIVFLIDLIIVYFVFKGNKVDAKAIAFERPEAFDDKQRKSLWLIGIFVVVLLLPFILKLIFPGSGFIKTLAANNDVAFTAILLSVVAAFLKVGDEKKAIMSVPWTTIVMVCGISILVSVAVQAGTIDLIVNAVTSIENPSVITILMTLGAGIMSIFSSTTGVVLPTLYPTVPAISSAAGIIPGLLFAAICTGSISTGMSPFSACGGILLGCVKEEDVKPMYKALLVIPFAALVIGALAIAVMILVF